jgi:hypothetical protein
MPNDLTEDDIRELVEDEVELSTKEINDALTALRGIKKNLDKTGDKPERLALVIALIRLLEKQLTRLGEVSLASLGQSNKIQDAIKILKDQRKQLDKVVDEGLTNAKKLDEAKAVIDKLTGAVDKLAKLTKPAK